MSIIIIIIIMNIIIIIIIINIRVLNSMLLIRNTLFIYLHIYKDDITWPCADTKFFFEYCNIFVNKENLESPCSHVIFYLLYENQ